VRSSRIRAKFLGATAAVVCGAAVLSFCLLNPWETASPQQPREVLDLLRETRRTQEATLAALEKLRSELKSRTGSQTRNDADEGRPYRDRRQDSDAVVVREPIRSIDEDIRRLLRSQGPIGSAEEALQLHRLPRTATDYAAIEQFLQRWPQSRRDLLYANIEEVVARFGFPEKASANGQYLVWEFSASKPLAEKPDRIVVTITRNHVVKIVGMPSRGNPPKRRTRGG